AIHRLQTFCSEDLGAFYLDILKDRLYTAPANSLARRSAQTGVYHITCALLKLLAPVLSFTAEEAWKDLHQNSNNHDASIFTELYHQLPVAPSHQALTDKWQRLRSIRADVMRHMEDIRGTGKIGSSLAASVTLRAPHNDY